MSEPSPPNNPKLVKVSVADIKVGMYMSQPDRPWLETSFLFQGFLLDSEKLLGKVRQECEFIYVDGDKSQVKPEQKFNNPVAPKVEAKVEISTKVVVKTVEQEFDNAYNKHKEAQFEIKEALKRMVEGEGINVTKIRQSVKSCVSSIMANPNAMLWLGKLRDSDDYVAEHCLNVGILAIAFGRHLGLEVEKLETLGLCGMLHDVGKMKVDQKLLNKPSSLTDEEFDQVREHCVMGRDILRQDSNLPKVTIEAAYCHHERMDGSGYPRGKKAASLSPYTKIISIVDVYDAITTNRCYDKSRPATEAIKILFAGRTTHFDPILVEKFIECMGIYPIGSLVELHSGEGAVVIDSNKNSRLHPRVNIVLDENKHNRQPLIVDTEAHSRSTGERTIKRVLDENDFNIDLEAVFSHFRVQKPA
ncbi:MAG: metal-dependent phosphohydrolase [SAR86 cluster bacterium]|uniref:Metal-dependent phosphohydrolase n=1 Tax=SAR86 cluster bacterium TaxID=2030880 RepID=A0A2A5AUI0_9GAMM|nr:MAG: metal-dependent phosphohydrolase [SAR86 cluster bacterium]